jgi:hypothetical protein
MSAEPKRNRTPRKEKLERAAELANESLIDKGKHNVRVRRIGKKLVVERVDQSE